MTEPLKSFSELKVARKKKEIEEVEPTYLIRLVDHVGGNVAAGKLLGLSDSYISGAIRKGKTRLAYEIAAKALYDELTGRNKKDRLFLVRVPSSKEELFKTFLDGLGAERKVISDL